MILAFFIFIPITTVGFAIDHFSEDTVQVKFETEGSLEVLNSLVELSQIFAKLTHTTIGGTTVRITLDSFSVKIKS